MATSTPWGMSDHTEHVAPGIIGYSTPSHGGYHLSARRVKELPAALRGIGEPDGRGGRWYEEDCDWAVVTWVWPQYFPTPYYLSTPEDAKKCLVSWYPDEWEALTGDTVQPSQSIVRRNQIEAREELTKITNPDELSILARIRAWAPFQEWHCLSTHKKGDMEWYQRLLQDYGAHAPH